MVTTKDIEHVRYCAEVEADKAYVTLDEFLNSLRLLRLENTPKYRTLSEAVVVLSLVTRHGIEVFEINADEHEHKENEW